MSAQGKITPDDKLQIVDLYRQGYAKFEIASMYGVSKHYIDKIIYDYLSSHNDAFSNFERKKQDDIAGNVTAARRDICIGDHVTIPETYEQEERSGVVTGKYPYFFVVKLHAGFNESFCYADMAMGIVVKR